MIWNPNTSAKRAWREKLLQFARLKNLVMTLYSRVPF